MEMQISQISGDDQSQPPAKQEEDSENGMQKSPWKDASKELKLDESSYTTMKILWDIIVTGADVISDFLQGITLFMTLENKMYGIVSLAIIWLPGLPTAFQFLSMNRRTMSFTKVVMGFLILLIGFPVLPFVLSLYIMYKKPKPNEPIPQDFKDAQMKAVYACAITGGLESPIQLIYQVWLVLNSVVTVDWIASMELSDIYGNRLKIPYTASVCICLSIISILKSVVTLNIQRNHGFLHVFLNFMKLLPFLMACSFFKIASLIAIVGYLNIFGLIVIGVMALVNLLIIFCIFKDKQEKVLKWLMVFMALFVPVFISFEKSNHLEQWKYFVIQTISSFIIYSLGLAHVIYYVNSHDSAFHYNPDMILNNQEFNVYSTVILVTGFLSVVLSWRLNFNESTTITAPIGNMLYEKYVSALKLIAPLMLVTVPLILAPAIINFALPQYHTSYIYFKQSINETVVFKAITINPSTNNTMMGSFRIISFENVTESGHLSADSGLDWIAAIRRDEWMHHSNQVLSMQPVAIIIIETETPRPSSPIGFLALNWSLPIFLIGNENQEILFRFNNTLAWLVDDVDLIEDPGWKCDDKNCLQANFSPDGHIVGNQYRTKTFIWEDEGLRKRRQEMQPICSEGNIKVCSFKDAREPVRGFFRDVVTGYTVLGSRLGSLILTGKSMPESLRPSYTDNNGQERHFRISPLSAKRQTLEWQVLAEDCQIKKKWTAWFHWEDKPRNRTSKELSRNKKRYCVVSNCNNGYGQCLLEEICCNFSGEGACSDPYKHIC